MGLEDGRRFALERYEKNPRCVFSAVGEDKIDAELPLWKSIDVKFDFISINYGCICLLALILSAPSTPALLSEPRETLMLYVISWS
jgi:hypothetical protein